MYCTAETTLARFREILDGVNWLNDTFLDKAVETDPLASPNLLLFRGLCLEVETCRARKGGDTWVKFCVFDYTSMISPTQRMLIVLRDLRIKPV